MNSPLISVCLPNLNTRPYLQERVDTILQQTYTNWEMVVSDNFSDDGSWEFFQEMARKDSRVLIAQAPRKGLYANWNTCIRRARGKYVYIATSDDTMADDCLEKLVGALEDHEECDLAHCTLKAIDKNSKVVPKFRWPDCTVFGHGLPGWANRRHVRRAPYDGLLHLTGSMVYLSITELLIRRSLFDRIGEFETRWGSMGDRNWDMKAGLVSNTIHVPDTWASWRIHPTQATAVQQNVRSMEYARNIEEMIQDALFKCQPNLQPRVVDGLKDHWLGWTGGMRTYYTGLRNLPSAFRRRVFQASVMFSGGASARTELINRVRGVPKWTERAPAEIKAWLESIGIEPVVAS